MTVMTAKEMKRYWRPKFQEHPEDYYPSEVFEKYGFHRARCPKCSTLYWRRTQQQSTCGDSECLGEYTFIGQCRAGKVAPTQKDVFRSFREHFATTEPLSHTLVPRYPVVARWRDDCEFTAAGIQCYQPFCVTGEVAPPANPLVQAQFCLRFNDIDSIGVSGRHYSGFHMLGIQAFHHQDARARWKDEVVEYNLQWLEKLGVDLDAVTLTADCWAGGGNLGPCVEYFIGGLEVGNMVFMEFRCAPDGSIERLPVRVVDVGIGLERIPWLLSGGITSYLTAFPAALAAFCDLTGFDRAKFAGDAWRRFAKFSCLLNADEADDIGQAWADVAAKCGCDDPNAFRAQITEVRDVYVVLDHLRSLLVAINDGALPGNVGGGSNLRNVVRRVFTIASQHPDWACLLEVPNIIKLMEAHVHDLQDIHGPESFTVPRATADIFELELQRWRTTDEQSRKKVEAILKKKKTLGVDDWVTIVTTYGLDPDSVSKITKQTIPENLYAKISEFQEKNCAKIAAPQLYDLRDQQPTDQMYYSRPEYEQVFEHEGANAIQLVLNDKEDNGRRRILVLRETIFYPTSGGQQHDTGWITVGNARLRVVDCTKVGPCVLHYLDVETDLQPGEYQIALAVDRERRVQLMAHHTGAHILSAACRLVLGPHVWQAGAKKTVEYATLDITHYQAISYEEQRAIEKQCMRIVQAGRPITKDELPKDEAERRYGFTLYQGGVVPGNVVRCVCIDQCDYEACCGTHMSSTSQVGLLKIQRSSRISDGVVRIQFVCGEAALHYEDEQENILESLKRSWGVDQQMIVQTGSKFFEGYKSGEKLVNQLQKEILRGRIVERKRGQLNKHMVTEGSPTRYLSEVGEYLAATLAEGEREARLDCRLVFCGDSFVVCFGAKDECAAIVSRVAAHGLKCKNMKLKMPGKLKCDDEMVLVTGLSDRKLYDDICSAWE